VSPRGTLYCPNCGEAIDPRLVEELRWLYGALQDLDGRIQRGEGGHTVAELRDDYRARYLAVRHAPAAVEVPAAAGAETYRPAVAPIPPTPPRAPVPSAPTPAPRVASEATPFSWSAFLADQAIAIMAYLGGFLLLVATLTFEVGAWQITTDTALNNHLKLAIVSVVYLLFGVLGFVLRRARQLRTIGGAYLGVFALMTPLVALAVYLFALQDLGISRAGMLSISAFYTAIVYLALAWRTRFATYAYLGWVALLVGSLAIVEWAAAPREWAFFVLGVVSLLLLAPDWLRRRMGRAEVAAIAAPALHLSVLSSLAALVGTIVLALIAWSTLTLPTGRGPDRAATACASVALVALLAAWDATLRGLDRPPAADVLDWLDLLFSASGIFGAVNVAIWVGATLPDLAALLAGLSLVELVGALTLGQARPARNALRRGMEGLALGVATLATLIVLFDPVPDWPLLAALAAGALIALGMALREHAPVSLLAAGPFLLVACARVAEDVRASDAATNLDALRPELLLTPTFYALPALALTLFGIALRRVPAARPYALPLQVIALAAALLATFALPLGATAGSHLITPQPDYQTALLLLFLLLGLAAGLEAQASAATLIITGFFGLLLPLPYLPTRDGLTPSLLAVAIALLALLVRSLRGRTAALALYGVALWLAAASAIHAAIPGVNTPIGPLLGISFAGWELLLIAWLATLAALMEGTPLASVVPAALALGAAALTHDPVAGAVLAFILFGVGATFARLRGRDWSLAWHAAGAFASAIAVGGLRGEGSYGPYWEVGVLIALLILTYLLSAQIRAPWGTALAVPYGLWAAIALPEPHALVATLALTVAIAIAGGVVRLRVGRGWALALYTLASGASLVTIARVSPFDARTVETLLLAFVALACVLAAIERAPVAGLVPAAYAIWAVILEPSAHTLLVFALAAAALALVLGRVAGFRWSLPWYLVAAVAGLAAGIRGSPDAGSEALGLLALAVAAYVVAAVESLPDVLPIPFLLGALSLGVAASWAQLEPWQTVLAYIVLSYVYAVGRWIWRAIPWLRPRDAGAAYRALGGTFGEALWTALRRDDPRALGAAVHVAAGYILALGTVLVAITTLNSFSPRTPGTQVVAIALLATGGLFAASGWLDGWRIGWYLAGEAAALAVTWQARYLGADNLQAYILAPGSYQLVIGALLPGDKRLGSPVWLGRWASLTGALLLLVPTLYQALSSGEELLYGSIMAVEAVLVVLLGVGTRSRTLVMVGLGFVAFAAIRGAMLAVSEGTPVWVVIAALAVVLMGAATWLSLRGRGNAPPSTADTPPAPAPSAES
jgi:hypothetical protein